MYAGPLTCTLLGPHLEERGEDVKGVDSAGAVRVGHQLVDVAAPGLLRVVAHGRLERRQDGGEEGRRRRGLVRLLERLLPLLFQAVTTATNNGSRRDADSGCATAPHAGGGEKNGNMSPHGLSRVTSPYMETLVPVRMCWCNISPNGCKKKTSWCCR